MLLVHMHILVPAVKNPTIRILNLFNLHVSYECTANIKRSMGGLESSRQVRGNLAIWYAYSNLESKKPPIRSPLSIVELKWQAKDYSLYKRRETKREVCNLYEFLNSETTQHNLSWPFSASKPKGNKCWEEINPKRKTTTTWKTTLKWAMERFSSPRSSGQTILLMSLTARYSDPRWVNSSLE